MLTTSGNQFLLNDKPFRILSGSIHYFRVMPEYWGDRLEKAKAFGLNTIETYVAWNLHEPRPGEFYFNGMLDLVRFIDTAAAMDLKVVLRPGPYICSEWDFGGLPAWLELDAEGLKGTVTALPKREDIQMPIDEQLIVELYSK